MVAFSVVICTYNPAAETFKRLLDAVLRFDSSSSVHEVIVIDNNSHPPLTSRTYINEFLLNKPSSRLIQETTPGLTAARIAGIKAAKYDWIVFFDDDNEPATDYLERSKSAIEHYPEAGAWGPGEIEVEFTGGIVAKWLENEKTLFQQRNDANTFFDRKQHWQPCYPFGTGLIIKKQVALLYQQRIQAKYYTLTDRRGKSLSSGGDVQLVFTCIEQGFAAGVIGGLGLKHLIDASKSTLSYLQKQQYGTASAYIKAYNQVFLSAPIPVLGVSNQQVLLTVYSLFRIHFNKMERERFRLLFATKMGELNARIEATGSKKPLLLRIYEKLIDV